MCLLSKLCLTPITLLLYNLNTVYSSGCSSGAIDSYEFVSNAVYGCDGEWTTPGVLNGEYLCGDDYSICDDTTHAEALGLTYALCVTTDIADNTYYVSGLSSDGTLDCDIAGNNDLFGCGTPNTLWNYVDNSTISCGPFGVQLSTDSYAIDGTSDGGWQYGWEVWNNGDQDNEFTQTTHLTGNQAMISFIGGVMCCLDYIPTTTNSGDDDMTSTMMKEYTSTTTMVAPSTTYINDITSTVTGTDETMTTTGTHMMTSTMVDSGSDMDTTMITTTASNDDDNTMSTTTLTVPDSMDSVETTNGDSYSTSTEDNDMTSTDTADMDIDTTMIPTAESPDSIDNDDMTTTMMDSRDDDAGMDTTDAEMDPDTMETTSDDMDIDGMDTTVDIPGGDGDSANIYSLSKWVIFMCVFSVVVYWM